MTLFISIFQTFVLLRMSWEDFSSRSIHIGLFILYGMSVFSQYYLTREELAINAFAAIFQFLLITLYVTIKNRAKQINILSYIGLGDLLFIAIAAVHFRPIMFQASLLLALVLSLIFGWISQSRTQPLAGIYALVVIAIQWLTISEVAFFYRNAFI